MSKSENVINVYDDKQMIEAGIIRYPNQSKRDPEVWQKTPAEKRIAKRYRMTEDMHFNNAPRKQVRVKAKLIIQLKKNKEFPNTTYSRECYMSEIPFILANYRRNGESLITKYQFNGQTYLPSELPYLLRI